MVVFRTGNKVAAGNAFDFVHFPMANQRESPSMKWLYAAEILLDQLVGCYFPPCRRPHKPHNLCICPNLLPFPNEALIGFYPLELLLLIRSFICGHSPRLRGDARGVSGSQEKHRTPHLNPPRLRGGGTPAIFLGRRRVAREVYAGATRPRVTTSAAPPPIRSNFFVNNCLALTPLPSANRPKP